jgi:hypothetical protein
MRESEVVVRFGKVSLVISSDESVLLDIVRLGKVSVVRSRFSLVARLGFFDFDELDGLFRREFCATTSLWETT